jgi:hypothetical protein
MTKTTETLITGVHGQWREKTQESPVTIKNVKNDEVREIEVKGVLLRSVSSLIPTWQKVLFPLTD